MERFYSGPAGIKPWGKKSGMKQCNNCRTRIINLHKKWLDHKQMSGSTYCPFKNKDGESCYTQYKRFARDEWKREDEERIKAKSLQKIMQMHKDPLLSVNDHGDWIVKSCKCESKICNPDWN